VVPPLGQGLPTASQPRIRRWSRFLSEDAVSSKLAAAGSYTEARRRWSRFLSEDAASTSDGAQGISQIDFRVREVNQDVFSHGPSKSPLQLQSSIHARRSRSSSSRRAIAEEA
jgi:hypothetical protein